MIGVDYELFWTLNPKSLAPFIKAFKLRQKYDDQLAWQHGVYTRLAIVSAMNKNAKYPKAPMLVTDDQPEISPEDQQKLIRERFMAHAKLINSRLGKE